MCQFLKDEIILHRIFFFALKTQISVSPEKNAHQITNDQNECMRVKKTKKGKFRDKIEWYAKFSLKMAALIVYFTRISQSDLQVRVGHAISNYIHFQLNI